MDKLLFLKRVVKKNPHENKCDRIIEDKVERRYYKFEDKFINKNGFYYISKKNESEIELLEIIKNLFYFDNKVPVIDFFNSIYCDGWEALNSIVRYIESSKESKEEFDIVIQIENEYKKIKYKINFKIEDNENRAIIIFRDDLSKESNKIISLFGGKQALRNKNSKAELNKNNPYIIMLNSNMEVPDMLEFKINAENTHSYKFNVVKSWKYDMKKMFDENVYLFFPLKIFDLEKRLFNISDESVCHDLVRYEVVRFFREMNNYLKKIKEKGIISQNDMHELNSIASNLLLNIINKETQTLAQIDKKFVDSLMITVS